MKKFKRNIKWILITLLTIVSLFYILLIATTNKYKVSFRDNDYLIMEGTGSNVEDYFWSPNDTEYSDEFNYQVLDEFYMSINVEFKLRPLTRKIKITSISNYVSKNVVFNDKHTHVEYDFDNPKSIPLKRDKIKMKNGIYFEPNVNVTFDGVIITEDDNDSLGHPSIDTGSFTYKYNSKYKMKQLYCQEKSIAEKKYYDKYWYFEIED